MNSPDIQMNLISRLCCHPERSAQRAVEGPRNPHSAHAARPFLSLLFTTLLTVFLTTTTFASHKTYLANTYGANPNGTTLNTASIQKAIDAAAANKDGGTITLKPGTYLTGSLFLKSNTTLEVPEGVTIIGSQKLEDYPMLPTRIAGIEMTWPAALINVRDKQNVTITGRGTIDGDGPTWWKSYWDLRTTYEPKGLRWASDYDARRPRLILFQNSSNIHLGGGILLKRSGFWTVQILYSHNVTLDGVTIRNNEGGKGPSTDGIDIDSSRNVLVQHADIDVNDDALCLKAGRDSDGLRVNRPTYNVKVHDSIIHHGAATITIGSETYTLEAEDAVYFDSGVRHSYHRAGKGPCTGVIITA